MGTSVLDSIQNGLNTELAVRIGVEEAILLQKVHYWISVNKKKSANFKDGRFWSEIKVKRVFASLERFLLEVIKNKA